MNNQSLNDGGPAFPSQFVALPGSGFDKGMSLRDYFAAKAMQAILTNGFQPDFARENLHNELDFNYVAAAYRIADAMLKERAKPAKE